VDSAGYIFYAVVDRDLTTGRDSIRRDVAQMGHVSATATLWGSPDHSKVLVLSPGSPSCGYVYDAATDSFSPCSSLSFNPAAPATATTNGDKWLVGSQLVDGSLNVIAPVGSSGLSPDGSVAYVRRIARTRARSRAGRHSGAYHGLSGGEPAVFVESSQWGVRLRDNASDRGRPHALRTTSTRIAVSRTLAIHGEQSFSGADVTARVVIP